MMKVLFVLAVTLVIALADGEIPLGFISDMNLTDAEDSFCYRWGSSFVGEMTNPDLGLPDLALYWNSVSVDVNEAGKSSLKNSDSIVAVAFASTETVHPFAVLGYDTGEEAAKMNPKSFVDAIVSGSSLFKEGKVAMAALSLEEITPEGECVKSSTIDLSSSSCSPKENKYNEITAMTCSMTFSGNPVKLTISFVTSSVAGILRYGESPLSPRSMDFIFQSENYKVSKKGNHARFNFALITGSASGARTNGYARVIEKDKEQVYVAVSNHAIINNKREEVAVSIEPGSNTLDSHVNNFLKLAMGENLDFYVAHIDFPPDVGDFIYDPAVGAGSVVYMAGASSIALSVLVALVCSIVFFLF